MRFIAHLTLEFEVASTEELRSYDAYCASEEDLRTDDSSSEEKNHHFPIYDAEDEKYDL